MEFFKGRDVSILLKENRNLARNKELAGRILIAYADMLFYLHSQDLIFIDNALESILVNENEVKICDYDLVSHVRDAASEDHFTRGVRHVLYASKEQVLNEGAGKISDLEDFALMMDHFFTGEPLIKNYRAEKEHIKQACENKREYKKSHMLPAHLKDVIRALLTYPREEKITIDDVREAIKLEFKI
jgi:serine/threonine protein kinase